MNSTILISSKVYLLIYPRYNCNRYDEDAAKKARDAQEVCVYRHLLLIMSHQKFLVFTSF